MGAELRRQTYGGGASGPLYYYGRTLTCSRAQAASSKDRERRGGKAYPVGSTQSMRTRGFHGQKAGNNNNTKLLS